jgi:hypothetical protein
MAVLEPDDAATLVETLPCLPSRSGLWWRVLRTLLRRRKDGGAIPAMSVEVPALRPDPVRLQAYRAVCGLADRALPITYPQVQAAPLQIHLLTQHAFPLPLLGMVHVRNTIRQFQVLDPVKDYRVRVDVQSGGVVQSGIEFLTVVRYYDGRALVWEAISTGLHRTRRRGAGFKRPVAAQELDRFESCATFDVPGDIGRRYGRVSRDLNPIHLWRLGGRLFGYPSHFAHGMWCLARSLALLQRDTPTVPTEVQIELKQPLFLPTRVSLWRLQTTDALEFALTTADLSRIHLRGSIRTGLDHVQPPAGR